MKRFYSFRTMLLPAIFMVFAFQAYSQNAWFNEFHYDNVSTDAGEFIEVVVQDAGSWDMTKFTVTLYNGNGGAVYNTLTLDAFSVGATIGSYTFLSFTFPPNGIQNGSPDGFSLDYDGTVLQFLSYEGTFTAVDGPAATLLSTDIGAVEGSGTPIGASIQLQGEGSAYADFMVWTALEFETKGDINTGQTLVELNATPLSDWAVVLGVLLIGLFAFFRIRRNS